MHIGNKPKEMFFSYDFMLRRQMQAQDEKIRAAALKAMTTDEPLTEEERQLIGCER